MRGEGECGAIRAPGGTSDVLVAVGELAKLTTLDVYDVQLRAQTAQEACAVDHDTWYPTRNS